MMKPSNKQHFIIERLSRFYQDNLSASEEAMSYLSERDIDLHQIRDFNLGFCPDSSSSYTFLSSLGFSWEDIRSIGVFSSFKNDRFANRIIFPVKNIQGSTVGFTARDLDGSSPFKYQNSEDSPFYKKSDNLFGIDLAKKSIFYHGFCFVVEGLFDCIQMHSAGFSNCVAILGTTITEQQICLLRLFCKHIVIMLDGDAAGQQAAACFPSKLAKFDISSSSIILPNEEDPDSLIRSYGALGFRNVIYDKVKSKLCKISI